MNYREVLKGKNREITEIRRAIATNKLIIKDNAQMLGSLKAFARKANRDGNFADVRRAMKEIVVRRSLVSQVEKAQVHNRQLLRETYLLRSALIQEWIFDEEEKKED